MIAIGYRSKSYSRPRSRQRAASDALWTSYPLFVSPSHHEIGEHVLPDPLLPSVADGQQGAAQRCLDQYAGLAWMLAKRYFAESADAEDAVQEAFVSLWQNAGRFDPAVASEPTFVTMIFRRRIIDLVRKKQRPRPEANSPEAEKATDTTNASELEVSEEAARVREHMSLLREEERRVIELGVCQGHSQARIAELTGWPLGTVKSHSRRGMKRLRELLAKGGMP